VLAPSPAAGACPDDSLQCPLLAVAATKGQAVAAAAARQTADTASTAAAEATAARGSEVFAGGGADAGVEGGGDEGRVEVAERVGRHLPHRGRHVS
jgi:hypothetical protein